MIFEVNKCYRTRDGRKATVLLIRPGYMIGEVQGIVGPVRWYTSGRSLRSQEAPTDLVTEWREPARVRATMARHRVTGSIHVFSGVLSDAWSVYELLDTFELVEGKGDR